MSHDQYPSEVEVQSRTEGKVVIEREDVQDGLECDGDSPRPMPSDQLERVRRPDGRAGEDPVGSLDTVLRQVPAQPVSVLDASRREGALIVWCVGVVGDGLRMPEEDDGPPDTGGVGWVCRRRR